MADTQAIWQKQQYATTWKGVGLYHITLTIPDRQPLLGTLQIPNDDPMQAIVSPTIFGHAVLDCQRSIAEHYPQIQVLHYCLMPDHLHAVWYVREVMPVGIATAVRGFWQGVKKVGRAYTYLSTISQAPSPSTLSSLSPNTIRDKFLTSSTSTLSSLSPNAIRDKFLTPSPSTLSSLSPNAIRDKFLTPSPSTLSSLSPNIIRDKSFVDGLSAQLSNSIYSTLSPVFSEMPHIQPMGKRRQLPATIRYMDMNPQRLATKRLKPGYLRVQRGIEIAGRMYDAVGNIALLHATEYMPVHVRRTMVEAAAHGDTHTLRDYMNSCVLAARRGTVMVSPFISPKEREVQKVLLEEKHPFIYLTDDPIGEYYKPYDALFDACAEGRILILHPSTDDYKPVEEKRPDGSHRIRRSACVALNGLAEEICQLSSINAGNPVGGNT